MQEKILKYFWLLKDKNHLASSYLFVGENFLLLKDIVKILICKEKGFLCNCWDCKAVDRESHPDVYIVKPQNIFIQIEDIREIQSFLSLKSFRSTLKVVIIKEAHRLREDSATAFLKTLEEPPRNSFIAISTSNLEALLPTIISRCQKIFLPPDESSLKSLNLSIIESIISKKAKFSDRNEFAFGILSLIILFRDYLVYKLTASERFLLNPDKYKVILKFFKNINNLSVETLYQLINQLFKIYNAYDSINENLAINLLNTELKKVNAF